MSGIPLSKTRGINPAMVKCGRCGKDTGEIALIGGGREFQCGGCGAKTMAYAMPRECPACGTRCRMTSLGEFDGMNGVAGICDECRAKQEDCDEAVRAGGVYWKCKACGSQGAVKAGAEVAVEVRAKLKIAPPAPCGVVFDGCPVCKPEMLKGGQ